METWGVRSGKSEATKRATSPRVHGVARSSRRVMRSASTSAARTVDPVGTDTPFCLAAARTRPAMYRSMVEE